MNAVVTLSWALLSVCSMDLFRQSSPPCLEVGVISPISQMWRVVRHLAPKVTQLVQEPGFTPQVALPLSPCF